MDKKKRRLAIEDLPDNAQADLSEDELRTITGGAVRNARWTGVRANGIRANGIRANVSAGARWIGKRFGAW